MYYLPVNRLVCPIPSRPMFTAIRGHSSEDNGDGGDDSQDPTDGVED